LYRMCQFAECPSLPECIEITSKLVATVTIVPRDIIPPRVNWRTRLLGGRRRKPPPKRSLDGHSEFFHCVLLLRFKPPDSIPPKRPEGFCARTWPGHRRRRRRRDSIPGPS